MRWYSSELTLAAELGGKGMSKTNSCSVDMTEVWQLMEALSAASENIESKLLDIVSKSAKEAAESMRDRCAEVCEELAAMYTDSAVKSNYEFLATEHRKHAGLASQLARDIRALPIGE